MDTHVLAALFAASFVNAALPGPCVILTFGRTVRSGVPAGLLVTAGILLGDLVLVTTAVTVTFGLVTLAPAIFPALKWAGIACLVILAIRSLPAAREDAATRPTRDGAAGFMLGVSSPYNLMFYGALLPQVMPMAAIDLRAALATGAVTMAAIAAVQGSVVVLAAVCRNPIAPRSRWLDYATATALLVIAAAAASVPMAPQAPAEPIEVSER